MAEAAAVRTLEDIRRLKPEILALARQCRAREVSLFGSLVRGQAGAQSDIDFLIDFEDDYKLLDHARLIYKLEDLLGRKVDVVPRSALREDIKPFVLDEAQPL